MTAPDLAAWIEHLNAIVEPVHRENRPSGAGILDEPFALAVLDRAGRAPAVESLPGEVALWWAVVDASVEVDGILEPPSASTLFPQDAYRAIEVWTEAELCGLHALWRLARQRGREDGRRRVQAVRDWHLENTQPDNATNRPWALHVFLLAGTPESVHYAETLLHNALAMTGEPAPLCAWILRDSARELEIAHNAGKDRQT